jgi:hypothetical protein
LCGFADSEHAPECRDQAAVSATDFTILAKTAHRNGTVPINLLASAAKCCYAQFMFKTISLLILGFTVCIGGSIAALAASEPCRDCKAAPELTIREQIKAQRAVDADRVAKESAVRPWDGTDIGQATRAPTTPVVR